MLQPIAEMVLCSVALAWNVLLWRLERERKEERGREGEKERRRESKLEDSGLEQNTDLRKGGKKRA